MSTEQVVCKYCGKKIKAPSAFGLSATPRRTHKGPCGYPCRGGASRGPGIAHHGQYCPCPKEKTDAK